jgi:hypothetical protein
VNQPVVSQTFTDGGEKENHTVSGLFPHSRRYPSFEHHLIGSQQSHRLIHFDCRLVGHYLFLDAQRGYQVMATGDLVI